MKKGNIKGFTIVELVIVIAIVAILAAILIPTFSSVIERANDSSDIQTVRQLNTAVATEAAEKGRPLEYEELLEVLKDYDFTLENLTPAGKDNEFLWHTGNKIFILVEKNDSDGWDLIYPLEDSDGTISIEPIEGNPVIKEITELLENLGNGEEEAFNLEKAITSGGNFFLEGATEITDPVTFAHNTTIDLKGYTFSIIDGATSDEDMQNIITISNGATLTITDTGAGGNINIGENYSSWFYYGGFSSILVENGTLDITGVEIVGGSYKNIKNCGTATLTDVTFSIASGGDAIENSGDLILNNVTFDLNSSKAIDNKDTGNVTIYGGRFTANGTEVLSVYNMGNISFDKTIFDEGDDFFSYDNGSSSPIFSGGVNMKMKSVAITVASSSYYSFCASSDCVVEILSGSFSRPFLCTGDSTSVTIYDGTFNSVAIADITEDSAIFLGNGLSRRKDDVNDCWIISK